MSATPHRPGHPGHQPQTRTNLGMAMCAASSKWLMQNCSHSWWSAVLVLEGVVGRGDGVRIGIRMIVGNHIDRGPGVRSQSRVDGCESPASQSQIERFLESAAQCARSRRLDRHHSTLGIATDSRLDARTVCQTFTSPGGSLTARVSPDAPARQRSRPRCDWRITFGPATRPGSPIGVNWQCPGPRPWSLSANQRSNTATGINALMLWPLCLEG